MTCQKSLLKAKTIKDIKRRIREITVGNRPVPESNNTVVLGAELKFRLALKSPVLKERRNGSRTEVSEKWPNRRRVPVHRINREGDIVTTQFVTL
ncbi:hypothetical protein ScPMuIL_000484 [Solemya velum]